MFSLRAKRVGTPSFPSLTSFDVAMASRGCGHVVTSFLIPLGLPCFKLPREHSTLIE